MRARGVGGELRVGYQTAARLGPWELRPSDLVPGHALVIIAGVIAWDDYWREQQPYDLWLQFGGETWIWRNVHVEGDSRISMIVGGGPEIR